MAMSLDELRRRLSQIEPEESMYAGIGVAEIPALTQLLADPEPWRAARAVCALARVSDNAAIAALTPTLSDPRVEVRVALASSARFLPVSAATAFLGRLLDDQEVGVRRFAARAAPMQSDADLRGKLQWLAAKDPTGLVRAEARDRLLSMQPAVFIEFDPAGLDIAGEHVVIRNNGAAPLDLTGWTLEDRVGHRVRLGAVVLPPEGELRVWTGTGVDDATNVHWGRHQAVWNNHGDVLRIADAAGKERVSVRYPPPRG